MNADPQDLLRLADEVAAATGPDTGLDHRIADVLHDWRNLGGWREQHKVTGEVRIFSYRPAPAYTASLDAAETLVPTGDDVTGERYRLAAYSTNGILMPIHVRASAWVPGAPRAFAATPAMALCAAALKARAHSTKETSNG